MTCIHLSGIDFNPKLNGRRIQGAIVPVGITKRLLQSGSSSPTTVDSLQNKVFIIVVCDGEGLSGSKSCRVAQFTTRSVSGKDPILVAVQVVAVQLSQCVQLVEGEALASVASLPAGKQFRSKTVKPFPAQGGVSNDSCYISAHSLTRKLQGWRSLRLSPNSSVSLSFRGAIRLTHPIKMIALMQHSLVNDRPQVLSDPPGRIDRLDVQALTQLPR